MEPSMHWNFNWRTDFLFSLEQISYFKCWTKKLYLKLGLLFREVGNLEGNGNWKFSFKEYSFPSLFSLILKQITKRKHKGNSKPKTSWMLKYKQGQSTAGWTNQNLERGLWFTKLVASSSNNHNHKLKIRLQGFFTITNSWFYELGPFVLQKLQLFAPIFQFSKLF